VDERLLFREWIRRHCVRVGGAEIFAELLGVDLTTINRWRRGVTYPSHPHVQHLAAATGATATAIVVMVQADRESVRKPPARVAAELARPYSRWHSLAS
jgi:DNA-binding transcriptional regulator YdaS (Cro superfamily)